MLVKIQLVENVTKKRYFICINKYFHIKIPKKIFYELAEFLKIDILEG